MGFKCPNCDTEHDKVPGYVAQDVLTQRLKAKTEEIDTLKSTLATTQAEAEAVTGLRAERDKLSSELEQVREASVIANAFAENGIQGDDTLRQSFRTIYDSHVAGLGAEDDKPSFVAWLASEDAKEHVLLKGHYGQAEDTQVDPNAPKPAPRRNIPDTRASADDPSPDAPKGVTPGDLYALTLTDAYKSLPYEQRKSLRAQWQKGITDGTLKTLPDIPAPLPKPG